jgi:polyhydroxyalkanoate synthase
MKAPWDLVSEWVSAWGPSAGQASAAGLDAVLRGAWDELRRDLSGLPDQAFVIDWEPLRRAHLHVFDGSADARDRAIVERWNAMLAVKARLGPEHYADPARVPVGPTPRILVGRPAPGVELFRYEGGDAAAESSGLGAGSARRAQPVLLVYSVINRSYILDLRPGDSFVRFLLDRGHEVYIVEWSRDGEPDPDATFEGYLAALHESVLAVSRDSGAPRVALFGHCIGGTLAAIEAALHPESVASLVALTAPFRAPSQGVLRALVDRAVFPADSLLAAHGRMPAKLVRWTFLQVKPWYEALKWKMFVDGIGDAAASERFLAVDRWANDNVDIPKDVFQRFVAEVFQEERLHRGLTEVGGRRVQLSEIRCPVWNLYGKADWIVPPDSAAPLHEAVAAARAVELPGAHLGFVLDPRQRGIWGEVSDFMSTASPDRAEPAPMATPGQAPPRARRKPRRRARESA